MQFLKFSKYSRKSFRVFSVLLFSALFLTVSSLEAQRKYKIVLDAGHGGKDPGNLGNGYKESIIALNVVLEIGKELEKYEDIEVIYTRKKNVFIELHKRAKIANDSKADLFVSVHCDSYNKPKVFGAGTFVLGLSGNKQNLEIAKRENAVILLEDDYKKNYDYDPNSPESVISLSVLQEENLDGSLAFAEMVQGNFTEAKRRNRSVKQNNFLVLRETVMPSVLIELGFLTNKEEGRFLNSKGGQIKMGRSVAGAIRKYIDQLKVNRIGGTTIKATTNQNNISVTAKRNKHIELTSNNSSNEVKKETKSAPKTVTKKKETVTIPEKKVVTEVKKEKIATIPPKKEVVVAKKEEPKVTPPKKQVVAEVKKETVKTPPKQEEKEIKKPTSKSQVTYTKSYIEFKVQIAASRVYLTDSNFNFKGLDNVEVLEIDEYFKYYYGSTSDYREAKLTLKDVKAAGHEGAFIVAFENGEKIPLYEAIKKQ